MRDIHLSIVSHGQGHYVERLLRDLARLESAGRFQVTLVINIPEPLRPIFSDCPFPLSMIENGRPQGFGQNHNLAFASPPLAEERAYFVVLNPDLLIGNDVMAPLVDELSRHPDAGVIAPAVRSATGALEDSARQLPTPLGLLRKAFRHEADGPPVDGHAVFSPDWVAGMFMLFPAQVFSALGGFDERYFLYYEDVDLCSRLWLEGYSVLLDPRQSIVHEAQRTSHRSWKYARWHLSSMLRFLGSAVCRRARRHHRTRVGRPVAAD